MGKKNKDEGPNANNVVNKDIMQRLNFMYQASVYLSGVLPIPPAPAPQKRQKRTRKMTVHDLSKSYVNSMKVVANKTMVKMHVPSLDPAVKRTLCNGCNIVLVPGSTASVRVKSSRHHGHIMVYRCGSCDSTRRIPAPPTLAEGDSAPSTSTHPDEAPPPVDEPYKPYKHKPRPRPRPRQPPLFARDAGHVVLRGNDKLPDRDPDLGDGIYIT
ncbi:RNAse P Rpr2/Rpp21/SNM1 subunit domain-containing protein [Mycena maculata]|uniref:RNAse P Rpr2/Rpp21/SNM1 subunit domain-containing protein n=1 Tax=Mycena maculata TaxID=230809 RepID=A0AAD7JVG6_9AGAR|nr:RNAse P Rpr2/Rpp21/SNM1 subunit domain-containing protein [Mycena maculata]